MVVAMSRRCIKQIKNIDNTAIIETRQTIIAEDLK
jgi:hypothetical protein